jgi:hypothetical protein
MFDDLKDKKINLSIQDSSFQHCEFSNNPLPPTSFSKHINWDRCTVDKNTIYTDNHIHSAPAESNIWLLEPVGVIPNIYNYVLENKERFKRIWTHEKNIFEKFNNAQFVPVGGCWISSSDRIIHNKFKNISIIASDKKNLEGHKLRHNVISVFKNSIDAYGNEYTPFKQFYCNKIEGLKDYRFHIAIENCKRDYYFSEKLIDCFATGTIPIYWGCPSIGQFFNIDGMILFNSIEELKEKLELCTPEYYESKKEAILNNFELAKQYYLAEDWIYTNLLQSITT